VIGIRSVRCAFFFPNSHPFVRRSLPCIGAPALLEIWADPKVGEWDPDNLLSAPTVIQVDQEMLFEIILAANYLDIKPLLCVD
jgi:hypothetical protein